MSPLEAADLIDRVGPRLVLRDGTIMESYILVGAIKTVLAAVRKVGDEKKSDKPSHGEGE